MKIINSIINIWKKIEHRLSTFQNEPYVERKCDRDGNLYWQVRDRKTNKSYIFGSDTEVRIWIEERYHST